MKKTKAKNEQIKRKYFNWLQEAHGYSDSTIESIEKAIWDYEAFSKEADFADFNAEKAKEFKKWLTAKKHNGNSMSLQTQYTRLRHLNKFFTWLSGQSGYKSKVSVYDVSYLKLSKRDSKIATSPKVQEYPSVDYVKQLCNSIKIENEIDMRDRALIAFTLLSGMRDMAIITLPMSCFNPDKLQVIQDPKKGVHTKFSKHISTTLFRFDEELIGYIVEWYEFLKSKKLFDSNDPLFPRTKVEQQSQQNFSFKANGVEPEFWKSVSAMRKIFEDRSKRAGLRYYSPHKYRHTATKEATDHCRSAEQIKAVGQNLGHEHVGTTLMTYGRLTYDRVSDVVSDLSFKKQNDDELKEQIKKLASQL